MSNFTFLQNEQRSLFQKMKRAEERVNTEPVSAANYCRLVLEECMHTIYDLEYIELPYNKELYSLMSNEEIKNLIPFRLVNGLHIVRKTGNNAAHYGKRISNSDALISIKYLFDFLKWFAQTYNEALPDVPETFNESLIPKIGEQQRKLKELEAEREREYKKLREELERVKKEKEALSAKVLKDEMALKTFKAKQEQAKEKLKEQKQERKVKASYEYTEADTRRHIIDINLKEAGWFNLRKAYELEYPVTGMPISSDNPKGNGYADYVLWGDDGKPIAVIEAKKTTVDIEAGRHQAFLYANCLENMHGQRPVIFFTNGYETKIWDDTFYSGPRQVYGFYTKEELHSLIQRRNNRKDIRKAPINKEIAGRPYQMEAIMRVAETFTTGEKEGVRGNKRNALLVMATGSGKTRTAAAIVDVLFKYNWVKRVLFLADRNALVSQAKNSFSDNLPELSSINLTEEKENDTTRLVFSTYQSMINKIDNVRYAKERFYGVGHFDLIIIDEAHRSVYNRYKSIFEYFDALIVGLTATPKKSIDHNTYELFECGTDDPTFNYDLEDAVPLYLKPFKNIDVSTKFLREGIKYKELSKKEKEKYEETFLDNTTGLFPEEINKNALNKWLFNKDTVFKVLDTLMKQGLKIEGGDKVGRTIVFAANQKHAEFIVDCFTERYPDKPAEFIATVHNKVSHAQSLIDAFCDHHKENLPQITVSVDMMDTGIDAPRVLNLVFFKAVHSYAKFWQMIGRGTRLCPDVFGPGEDKEHFLIFDVCQNFEFFNEHKEGTDGKAIKPITQQIFEARLHVSRLLTETGEPEDLELAKETLDILHSSIKNLDEERFQVKMKLRYVEEFKERSRWNNLNSDDIHIIEEHLSELPVPESINETARRFDLLMLKLQIANLLMLSTEKSYHEKLMNIAERLSGKYTIPHVEKSKGLIESMKNPEFYKALKQKKLNEIREEIRELVQYLDAKEKETVYTNIQDSPVEVSDGAEVNSQKGNLIYKRRVESFIRENNDHLVIAKLSSNKPITASELKILENILFDGSERGTKEDFHEQYGDQPLGKFIRSILGLELEAANEAFADFLQAGNLRADQITFINNIISFLTTNGTIDKKLLFEPPFTDINDQGLLGVFDDADSGKIIRIIDEINSNANVG